MDTLFSTAVVPEQIDHLGHMNVRFYAQHARTAARTLLESVGLGGEDGPTMQMHDLYVRHHREQLVEANLAVRGGVLSADATQLRLYEELYNVDSAALAATFVLSFHPIDPVSGSRQPVAARAVEAATEPGNIIEIPEHGRSRSIAFDDDPVAAAPSLEELQSRSLAMRTVRTLTAEECDADGRLPQSAVAELVWGGEPIEDQQFMPTFEVEGRTIGVATMETRGSWARLPEAGDRVQSFGAEVSLKERSVLSRHWVYDVDRAALVCTFAVVGVGFDLTTRRAVTFPDPLRAAFAQRLHTDLT